MCSNDLAKRIRASGIADAVALVVLEQCLERVEVLREDFEEWSAVGGVCGEEFRECQLHFVFTDEPCAEFGLRRVSAGEKRLLQGFAAQETAPDDVCERGIA